MASRLIFFCFLTSCSTQVSEEKNKVVIDCGNCSPDHSTLSQVVRSNFGISVVRTHGCDDTLEALDQHAVALVTVNRRLDRDGSDGMTVIKNIKSHPRFGHIPVMMVTNFADHQQRAIEAGCVPGFGKASVHDQSTLELLKTHLGES